jgi:hypothetical protein
MAELEILQHTRPGFLILCVTKSTLGSYLFGVRKELSSPKGDRTIYRQERKAAVLRGSPNQDCYTPLWEVVDYCSVRIVGYSEQHSYRALSRHRVANPGRAAIPRVVIFVPTQVAFDKLTQYRIRPKSISNHNCARAIFPFLINNLLTSRHSIALPGCYKKDERENP